MLGDEFPPRPLAPLLADFAGVKPGQRLLDVGCGPGALTAELVNRVGARHVAAADPSEGFARAALSLDPAVPDEARALRDAVFQRLGAPGSSFTLTPVRGQCETTARLAAVNLVHRARAIGLLAVAGELEQRVERLAPGAVEADEDLVLHGGERGSASARRSAPGWVR